MGSGEIDTPFIAHFETQGDRVKSDHYMYI